MHRVDLKQAFDRLPACTTSIAFSWRIVHCHDVPCFRRAASHIGDGSLYRAIESKASTLAEGFLYALAACLILGEQTRSTRNQSKGRDAVDDQLDELKSSVKNPGCLIRAKWRSWAMGGARARARSSPSRWRRRRARRRSCTGASATSLSSTAARSGASRRTSLRSTRKTTHLKNNSLAPPDFLTNSVQGITWRLGFGIDNKNEPEEWQNHPADVNLALTADIVSDPAAIWKKVADTLL
ncbi:hypothetical protein BD310DRAFT_923445 [Dichomitus squalens]|uniref:Uncharacterized protein n=1 Tax=Dichomitus squalens TaxID=114155 RepID=A0A4Q9PZM9_9APHY|nr:hypothetical protein BD310DRAFT_923445 [Dichomitus squalens]